MIVFLDPTLANLLIVIRSQQGNAHTAVCERCEPDRVFPTAIHTSCRCAWCCRYNRAGNRRHIRARHCPHCRRRSPGVQVRTASKPPYNCAGYDIAGRVLAKILGVRGGVCASFGFKEVAKRRVGCDRFLRRRHVILCPDILDRVDLWCDGRTRIDNEGTEDSCNTSDR
jgi:hypothetical protein